MHIIMQTRVSNSVTLGIPEKKQQPCRYNKINQVCNCSEFLSDLKMNLFISVLDIISRPCHVALQIYLALYFYLFSSKATSAYVGNLSATCGLDRHVRR